jgi:hypothetical protein
MNPKTKKQALDALEGMKEIVKKEMLVRGEYLTQEIVNPKLANAGAICGGRQYCAIGSLWAGAGIHPQKDKDGNWILPGADADHPNRGSREVFLRNRHGLRTAYNALNAAAEQHIQRHGIETEGEFEAAIEDLFESFDYAEDDSDYTPRYAVDPQDLIKIIDSARRILLGLDQWDRDSLEDSPVARWSS